MLLETLKKFLADEDAWDMFITGRAGTGKTTSLAEVIEFLHSTKSAYVVCAFTHKACEVLRAKLPEGANITTLHSFLKKRPGLNEHASQVAHVEISTKFGDTEHTPIVIIDEYSMIGEKDYQDLVELQSKDEINGKPTAKLIYVGDPFQLPPVKDMQAIEPGGEYWVKLTKIHRTDNQDLMDIATQLVSFVQGAPLKPLQPSRNFIRGKNLIKAYKESTEQEKILLAWTNKAVQNLNFEIAGKPHPEIGDALWNASTRDELVFCDSVDPLELDQIETVVGPLLLNSKYKTLEFLQTIPGIEFFKVENIAAEETQNIAVVFGTYNYKQYLAALTSDAVNINNQITSKYNESAATWSRQHPHTALARERAMAWRKLLAVKEAVMCVDFPYAMTVHKSQGSTYSEVYLDSKDLSQCYDKSPQMYARLFYVAISRASKRVITN